MRNAVIAPLTRGDHAPVKRDDMAQLMAIKGHLFRARCGPLGLEMHHHPELLGAMAPKIKRE